MRIGLIRTSGGPAVADHTERSMKAPSREFIRGSSSPHYTGVIVKTFLHMLIAFWAAAGLAHAQPAASVAVTGVVQDQTGAALPQATVELVNTAGAVLQTITTDPAGAFRFDRVAPGAYELRAGYAGFNPAIVALRVGARAPASQRVVLNLA